MMIWGQKLKSQTEQMFSALASNSNIEIRIVRIRLRTIKSAPQLFRHTARPKIFDQAQQHARAGIGVGELDMVRIAQLPCIQSENAADILIEKAFAQDSLGRRRRHIT